MSLLQIGFLSIDILKIKWPEIGRYQPKPQHSMKHANDGMLLKVNLETLEPARSNGQFIKNRKTFTFSYLKGELPEYEGISS